MSDKRKCFAIAKPYPTWKPSDGIWVSERTIYGQPREGIDKLVLWAPPLPRVGLNERKLTKEEQEILDAGKRRWKRWKKHQLWLARRKHKKLVYMAAE